MDTHTRERDLDGMREQAREYAARERKKKAASRRGGIPFPGMSGRRGEAEKADGDSMLILMLIMLLSSEGGDQALLFALLYIMM